MESRSYCCGSAPMPQVAAAVSAVLGIRMHAQHSPMDGPWYSSEDVVATLRAVREADPRDAAGVATFAARKASDPSITLTLSDPEPGRTGPTCLDSSICVVSVEGSRQAVETIERRLQAAGLALTRLGELPVRPLPSTPGPVATARTGAPAKQAPKALRQSASMGLLCMPVGALVGLWVAGRAAGSGYGAFLLCALLAAFVAATLCWWLLVARPRRFGPVRGAFAGAVSAVAGHWLCWALFVVGNSVWRSRAAIGGGPGSELPDPVEALAGTLALAAWSLVVVGWLTVPAGAVIGAALAVFQRGRANATH